MTIIIATVQAILFYAWMFICMFAAFELALYLVAAAVDMIMSVRSEGWRVLTTSPLRVLREAHEAGVMSLKNQRFALV